MTAFNTGNPIGSTNPKDLYDNAQNLDVLVNSNTDVSHADRLGVQRKTWHGMESEFDADQTQRSSEFAQFLADSAYQDLGVYGAGIEVTRYNQVFLKDGEFYRAAATLVLPYTTTGVWVSESASFVGVGDAVLRQDLATQDGADLVGFDGGTAQDVLDNAKPMANYTALRAYTGRATGVRITQTGLAGFFQRDDADTISADNGGTIIVDASGRRWKRLFSGSLNVMWFGANGDWNGTTGTDNYEAIQGAINAADMLVVGKVEIPRGSYYISKPIEVASAVDIVGDGQYTHIIKTNAALSTGGIDCVIYGKDKQRFQIQNIRVRGNRVKSLGVVTASTHGFYMDGCNYFGIFNTRAQECVNGYVYETCWCCSLEQATAQQCQQYGFILRESTTSVVLRNTTAWGTGGGWRLDGVVYSQLIGCACDYSDAGGASNDPFAASGGSGSGGDYLNPQYIFRLSACQGITIVSPGCENSYSKWLYAEGAFATITSPYVYNLKCSANNYAFCETRGSGGSAISIQNPQFADITNTVGIGFTRRGYFVENTQVQRIYLSGITSQINGAFGIYSVLGIPGVEILGKNAAARFTQENMLIGGGQPFLLSHSTGETVGTASIVESGGEKILRLKATNDTAFSRFRIKLPDGFKHVMLQMAFGYVSTYQTADVKIIETDGTTINNLKSWTGSTGAVSIAESFTLPTLSAGYKAYLQIQLRHTSETFDLKNFVLDLNYL